MARAKIKMNRRTMGEYLAGKHGVERLLDTEANAALQRARGSAPVASGAYRDSLHVETAHTDRMVKRVTADVPYAFMVEANTGNLARSL